MTHNIAKSSLAVTFFAGLVAGVSFLNQMVIARYFGASAELDAYLTAGALPSTFSGILLAGIGYTLIPILSKAPADQTDRAITGCFLLTLILGLGIGIAGGISGRFILRWTAPYLPAEKYLLSATLQLFFWPVAASSVLTSFLVGLSHFRKRFALAAASNAIPYVSAILCAITLSSRWGIFSIAVGLLAGCILQTAVLWWGAPDKHSMRPLEFTPFSGQFSRAMFPVLFTLLPYTLPPMIDAFWSSALPHGSLSYLGYANRIVIGLTSVSVLGVAVVIFPFLSADAAAGEKGQMRARIRATVKFVFLVLVPAAVLLGVLRAPILRLVFQRGSFDEAATAGLAAVLPWYLIGMVGMASMNVLSRSFYALSDFKTPALLGAGFLAFYFVSSGILSSRFLHVGIGITYAAYWTLQSGLAAFWLSRRVGGIWTWDDLKFLGKVVTVSVTVGLILYEANLYISWDVTWVFRTLCLGSAGVGLLSLISYLVFSVEERRWVTGMVQRGLR